MLVNMAVALFYFNNVFDGQFYPIQCMSKNNSPQEEKLCRYKLEALVVITALKKFKVYLHGTKF